MSMYKEMKRETDQLMEGMFNGSTLKDVVKILHFFGICGYETIGNTFFITVSPNMAYLIKFDPFNVCIDSFFLDRIGPTVYLKSSTKRVDI